MQEQNGRPRQPKVAKFVQKVFRLASDPDNQDMISFGPNGFGLIIKQQLKFVKNVMQQHFKAKKFGSMVRQLNSYGFQSSTQDDRKLIFNHPNFIRDQPQELLKIQRKPIRQEAIQRGQVLQPLQNVQNQNNEQLLK